MALLPFYLLAVDVFHPVYFSDMSLRPALTVHISTLAAIPDPITSSYP